MANAGLGKNIFISLLWHVSLFFVFGISFGHKNPVLIQPPISFWGEVLSKYDVVSSESRMSAYKPLIKTDIFYARDTVRKKWDRVMPDKKLQEEFPVNLPLYIKPSLTLAFDDAKRDLSPRFETPVLSRRRQDAITFRPSLPQHFILYFKDRQSAHIELMFKIVDTKSAHYTVLQRKISSGNLEFDLLSKRYIGYYLFIQHNRFPLNKWQTVKIDLSP